jgi:hypothetical protein
MDMTGLRDWRPIAAAAELIKAKSFTIDGEAFVLGPNDLSRSEELSRRQAARTAINEMTMDNGVMKMRPLASGLEIKPGEKRPARNWTKARRQQSRAAALGSPHSASWPGAVSYQARGQ